MLMIYRALNIIDSSVWHAAPFEDVEPLLRCLRLELVFYDPIESIPVLHSQCVRDEARICLPLRLPNLVAENAVEPIVAAANRDIRVLCFVCTVRDHGRCSSGQLTHSPSCSHREKRN